MKSIRKIQKTKEDNRVKTAKERACTAKARVQAAETRACEAKTRAQIATERADNSKIKSHIIDTAAPDKVKKIAIEIDKAESEARMADNKAKIAEVEARRAMMKAEAHSYKAKIEVDKAEECAQQVATQAEAKAKFLAAQAEAEVKREKAKEIKTKANKTKEISDTEVNKIRKEAHSAEAIAKKAKIIIDKAIAAVDAKAKHTLVASQEKAKAAIYRAEAEDRMAEANARKAEANARREEAKAIKAGDKVKAQAKRTEAQVKKAEALAIQARVDLAKIERKVKAEANAEKILKGPFPPSDKRPEKRARKVEKKHLSQPGLLNQVRDTFLQVPDRDKRANQSEEKISLCDCLMSALAVFSLKYPSLLQFENDSQEGGPIHHNLKFLYNVSRVPSDTYMRERLDVIEPEALRPAFKKLFSTLQRGKELENYVFYNDYYLLLGDATGYFSSKKVHCENCCKKEHQDGSVTYYHQMMSAVIAHPDHAAVIPLCPEPIIKTDGSAKNDCERNASERLYRHIRREHPHLRLIVTEDALGSNGPHIRLLQELDMRFILVVKPDGNKSLFEHLKRIKQEECIYSDDKFTYKFQFINKIPLSDSHFDLEVNFIEAWVYDHAGNLCYHNTWITDINVTKENAYKIFQGGRAKWKIENETFNTLKNQDYHFEHNYGHGKQHLSTILALLMMLAFLIDQIQQSCCGLFQAAWEKMKSKVRLWGRLRAYFTTLYINSWEDLWQAIACGHAGILNAPPNTS